MRKRKRIITEAGHEDRWLVSYADFITLLFAFFVVMYSISSLNEAKYKSLMHSIGSAFSNKSQPVNGSVPEQIPLRTPAALESVPDLTQAQAPEKSTLPNNPEEQEEAEKKRRLSEEIIKEQKQLKQVSEQLKAALEPFVDANLVSVINNDFWITLQMNSELLFASGAAEVSKKSIPIIQKIAEVIEPMLMPLMSKVIPIMCLLPLRCFALTGIYHRHERLA
ncbi:flagellar motor protein MotB [Methylocucumis oryzae]|uniref:flagellar motor protein MotB n=1 Tax=Methylocucumis oryzae TaxID=1632867 RepID=UPI000AF439A3|nr:flagellar motor protein MotB [Methylocucumis oryzae]